VDILVNNARFAGSATDFRRFHEIDVDEWDDVLAVNLRAAMLLCRAVVPEMLSRGKGSTRWR
jgi:NAD(P)-dependent dehydrogenase (short-subunit alcohol dehydrogenase family)